jgi:hypothetical protein
MGLHVSKFVEIDDGGNGWLRECSVSMHASVGSMSYFQSGDHCQDRESGENGERNPR